MNVTYLRQFEGLQPLCDDSPKDNKTFYKLIIFINEFFV